MSAAPAIVVCADDYGMSEGVSGVIADLLERGALSATTCLVEAPAWPQTFGRLREVSDRLGIAVGLHLDLSSPMTGAGDALTAFRAQWRRFETDFGRPPDFVDGHRHVHLFPGPRRALFRLLVETKATGWVRQCQTSSGRMSLKRVVLDGLSLGLRRQAAREGRRTNPGFGGLRRFDPAEDVAGLWRRDLTAMRAGGILMTHPGALDPADEIAAARVQEAGLLADGAVSEAMAQAGLVMRGAAARWDQDFAG